MSTAITTWEELAALAGASGDHHLALTLDALNPAHYSDPAANLTAWTTGAGWLPIAGFVGSLDGRGFEIQNLFINRPTTAYVGLIGDLGSVDLLNITMRGATVTGQSAVGALAGRSIHALASAVNCCAYGGTIHATGGESGALFGRYQGSFVDLLYTESNTVTAEGSSGRAGGLVGNLMPQLGSGSGRCLSVDNYVASHRRAGALASTVRYLSRSASIDCTVEILSSGSGNRLAGGFAGSADDLDICAAIRPHVIMRPGTGGSWTRAGAFMGQTRQTTQVNDCYTVGAEMEGVGTNAIAGFLAYHNNTHLLRCFSASSVLAWSADRDRSIFEMSTLGGSWSANFCDGDLWPTATTSRSTLSNTASMQSISMWQTAGYDIVQVAPGDYDTGHVWNIVEGSSYPFHSWMQENPIPGPPIIEDWSESLGSANMEIIAPVKLPEQFKRKTRIVGLLRSWLNPFTEIFSAMQDLKALRSIDTAEGEQLDVIGRVVGLERMTTDDEVYRLRLRVQILINLSDGTAEHIIRALSVLLPDHDIEYVMGSIYEFRVRIHGLLPTGGDIAAGVVRQMKPAGSYAYTEYAEEAPAFMWDTAGHGWDEGKWTRANKG